MWWAVPNLNDFDWNFQLEFHHGGLDKVILSLCIVIVLSIFKYRILYEIKLMHEIFRASKGHVILNVI